MILKYLKCLNVLQKIVGSLRKTNWKSLLSEIRERGVAFLFNFFNVSFPHSSHCSLPKILLFQQSALLIARHLFSFAFICFFVEKGEKRTVRISREMLPRLLNQFFPQFSSDCLLCEFSAPIDFAFLPFISLTHWVILLIIFHLISFTTLEIYINNSKNKLMIWKLKMVI